jgi:hypothetical protein
MAASRREQLAFPGLGERILARLVKLGYVTPTGAPNQKRFIEHKRYPHPSFYFWTRNERTPGNLAILQRLARDLRVSMCWLLMGPRGERDVLAHRSSSRNGAGRGSRRRGRRCSAGRTGKR